MWQNITDMGVWTLGTTPAPSAEPWQLNNFRFVRVHLRSTQQPRGPTFTQQGHWTNPPTAGGMLQSASEHVFFSPWDFFKLTGEHCILNPRKEQHIKNLVGFTDTSLTKSIWKPFLGLFCLSGVLLLQSASLPSTAVIHRWSGASSSSRTDSLKVPD